ncbi:MAG: hypothetical protein BGO69_19470 [Bacteroidetes bacterium 46-16]|nr:MAG: hypothetical protein BGO69_19470 [Bacteroidetes bacterium 46-16]
MANSWDFTEENTKTLTHGFHMYPAMMIPQVASRLIDSFKSKKSNFLFDPYCGTGTSLVEANVRGIDAIGTDLNPLARILASAKTTVIEQKTLDLYLKDFYDHLFQFRMGFSKNDSIPIIDEIDIPHFSNIDFWFSKSVKQDLAIIKAYIDTLESESVRNFFNVAFSQTIRDCSWTRKNEFKLYKMDSEKVKTFKPNVFAHIEQVLKSNRFALLDFMNQKRQPSISHVYDFNTVSGIPLEIVPNRSVNLVVTSPPYGDSQTTVAYGQFSRLANEWLSYSNSQAIDRNLMGGKKHEAIERFDCSRTLNGQIAEIKARSQKRALEVYSFYKDYYDSIANISRIVKKNGHACYVVSNRCVQGVTLKTDLITKHFFEENGFRHVQTFTRKISSKRMPRKNSPTGIAGKASTLMNKEYIVIMKKA